MLRRSQEYLQTSEHAETSEEKLRENFRKQLLLVAGFSQEEVGKMDIPSISDEELQATVRKQLLGTDTNNHRRQKVVDIDEAEEYLAQGWEYVASLPNGRVIIKLKT